MPKGDQGTIFDGQSISPLVKDILIAKLASGQVLDLEMHCIKGLGKEHAKWSPVSLCSYRLMPKITITEPILDKDAEKLVQCFPPGVIKLAKTPKGRVCAKVDNERLDTVSRECLRHPEFEKKVLLKRVSDHFICKLITILLVNLETVSFFSPDTVFVESLQILSSKCARLLSLLENTKIE